MLIFLGFLCAAATATPHEPPNTSSLAACFRDPACHQKIAASHRGKGMGAYENSRDALRKAVQYGVPMVEIDLQMSKDKEIYLTHQDTVEYEPGKKAPVHSLTSAQLANVKLPNGETLPRFSEIYEIAKGHVMLDLDFKEDIIVAVARWIAANGSFDDVLFFGGGWGEWKSLVKAKKSFPQMLVMARAQKARVRYDLWRIGLAFGDHPPEAIHIDYPWGGLLKELQDKGYKLMAKLSDTEDFPEAEREAAIADFLNSSLDMRQTDYPLDILP